jgi:excisionase family DNA binding protein
MTATLHEDNRRDLNHLPAFLDQEGTSKLLGISRGAFYELVRTGQLPGAFRLGKHIRVNREVLLASLGQPQKEETPQVEGPGNPSSRGGTYQW